MRITHLWRYPVKSLGGEPLHETRLDHGGMPFDRSYRLVDGLDGRAGKTLTGRQLPGLLAFKAFAAQDGVRIEGPKSAIISAGEELAQVLRTSFARPLQIQKTEPGAYPFFDDSDLLVINAASVRALGQEIGIPMDTRRFRPSIVLDGDDAMPFVEDAWVGRGFAAGSAEIAVTKRDIRCVFTNVDPETCEINPAILQHLVQRHDQRFGVYARVVRPGRIAAGDEWRPL